MTPARRRSVLVAAAVLTVSAGCAKTIEAPPGTDGRAGPTSSDATRAPGPASDPGSTSPSANGEPGYRFLRTREDGTPVRWSTCEPIRWVVRPDGEPEGARRLLEDSVRRISEASGLAFSFAGTTDEAPRRDRPAYQPDRYGDGWAPVLIAYSGPQEDARLKGRRAGYGGPSTARSAGRAPRHVTGAVVFDTEQMIAMGGDAAARAIMLHELAHLAGLGHVRDRRQLMNPVLYGRRLTTLQDGDRAGLRALGAGGCLEPVDHRAFSR